MQHIKLKNSTILQTRNGPVTISPSSFNYRKILSLLDSPSTDDEIYELLKPPLLPEGIFTLFTAEGAQYSIIQSFNKHAQKRYILHNGQFNEVSVVLTKTLLGVFTSLDDIRDSYPELFI